MATLTVNDVEFQVLGRASWAPAREVRGRPYPAYIEALVDTSAARTEALDTTNGTIRLTLSDGAVEGHSMVQTTGLETNGYETFARYEGQEVSKI